MEAIVRNISPTGVLLETDQPIAINQTIHIDLGAAGRQAAGVRWVDGKLMGCQFLESLTKSRLSATLLQGRHDKMGWPKIAASASSPLALGSPRRNFGLAIAWARKAKGVNQAEMARAIGVSTTTLCRWEKGHVQPRSAALARLQNYLQDAEIFAAERSCVQNMPSKTPESDIQRMASELKASLAKQLGVKVEEIEIQLMIKDVARA